MVSFHVTIGGNFGREFDQCDVVDQEEGVPVLVHYEIPAYHGDLRRFSYLNVVCPQNYLHEGGAEVEEYKYLVYGY